MADPTATLQARRPGERSLSRRTRTVVEEECRRVSGRATYWLDPDGTILSELGGDSPLRLAPLQAAVSESLNEASRWGEPSIFFLCPGVLAWVVPLCDGDRHLGGLLSGEVLRDETDRAEVWQFLCSSGLAEPAASRYAERLPVWEQGEPSAAASGLYSSFYRSSGWTPDGLSRRREDAAQQREIAQAIHFRKRTTRGGYPIREERRLLAMIRIGDRTGARGVLNELLAGLFLHSPAVPALRARCLELVGYLVRAAVDDNPLLEPLLERNEQWSERLVSAADFDDLCVALRDVLDGFLAAVANPGHGHVNPAVGRVLEFVSAHYMERLTLEEVARAVCLSPYRVAHLIKDETGRTVMEHVRVLRAAKARELLETTTLRGSEIAAQLGYHDQSHLIREFRALTGTTPTRYRQSFAS